MEERRCNLEDLELELWFRLRNSGSLTWTTKSGKVIPIKDMSDLHLINTINMLTSKLEREQQYEEALGSIGDMDF